MSEAQQTESEWLAEGERLFGPNKLDWKFRCPRCGHVQTAEDFKPYSVNGAIPNCATDRCIGRFDRSITDCDWAAFGLLTLPGTRLVIPENQEEPVRAFDFATEEE